MFTRMNVSRRIALGFGLLVALSMAQAAFSVLQFGEVNGQTRRTLALAGNAQRVLAATDALETVRRAETHYRLDGDEESLQVRRLAVAQVAGLVEGAARTMVPGTQLAIYSTLLGALDQHDEIFARLVQQTGIVSRENKRLDEGGTTLSLAAAKLVGAARALEDAEVRDIANEVERALLVIRINNWRFQALYDPKGPGLFSKSVLRARAALAELGRSKRPELRDMQAPLEAATNAYAESFDAMSAAMLASIETDEKALVPEIVAMQEQLDSAKNRLETDFAGSGRQTLDVSQRSSRLQQAVAVAVVVLGGVLAWLIGRGVTRPITSMTKAMTRLAGGDKSIVVPARRRVDEIGGMASAVEVFLRQAIENDRLAAEQACEQAAKERRQTAMNRHTEVFGQSVSGVMASLMAAAETMRTAAADVGDSARTTRSSTSATVEGAAASARDLSSVAAATEEVASSIREISKQVEQVNVAVQLVVDRTSDTSAKVNSLSDNADRIGDVVRLINSVASQTKLLALNASIEAARAGDAGKGFAVVAGEVKALAAQTARATDLITAQIQTIRGGTREAVAVVREVVGAIGTVADIAGAISAAVETQTRATREISDSVQQITETTITASNEMRSVLAIAERTDQCSNAALAASEEVGRTAGTLRSEVNDFLAAMATGGVGGSTAPAGSGALHRSVQRATQECVTA